MKRVILLIFLFILYFILINHKMKYAFAEKIDLNLNIDEIGIILFDDGYNNFLLIQKNSENNLVLLSDVNSEKKIINSLNVFGVSNVNYIVSDNIISKIKFNKLYTTKDTINFSNINMRRKENILILKIFDYSLCIYEYGNNNVDECTFIYFKDIDENVKINDNNKVVFYNKNITDSFKEELYTKWIDIYSIDKSNYTVLKIKKDNYNIINIPS